MNDYIRVYLGLMGSGKTTQALKDVERHERCIVYSPGFSNPMLSAYPAITDEDRYVQNFEKILRVHPRVRIEKRLSPSLMFQVLGRVRGYSIVLDDIAALKTHGQEKTDFESFLRTVRFNGNQVVITTHRARKDLPPLVHVIGTSFYFIGPGPRSTREIETLYELVNYPISQEGFTQGLETNPSRDKTRSAGIFPIRKSI